MRFRATLQLSQLDCGPANVLGLIRALGGVAERSQVYELCGNLDSGTSLSGLQSAVRAVGLEAEIHPLDIHDLRRHSDDYLPAVVALSGPTALRHFVTVYGFKGNRAMVMDPAVGLVMLDVDDLWTRMAREPVPLTDDSLAAEESSPSNRADLAGRLRGIGIDAATVDRWLLSHSLFRLDDCTKYAAALCRLNGGRAFGPQSEVVRSLLEDPRFSVPTRFTSYSIGQDGRPRLMMPLVMVVRRPRPHAQFREDRKHQRKWDSRSRVLALWRRHWRLWLPLPVFATSLLALQLTSPLAMQLVIDSLNQSWPPVAVIIGAACVAQLLAAVFGGCHNVVASRQEKRLGIAWTAAFVGELQRVAAKTDRGRSSGELLTRADECSALARSVTAWGALMWRAGLGVLATSLALLSIWWLLLAIPVLGFVISALVQEAMIARIALRDRRGIEAGAQLNAVLVEQIRGLETLRLVEGEMASFAAYDEQLALASREQVQAAHWRSLLGVATGVVGGATLLAMALAAYSGLVSGSLTAGQIVSAFAFAGLFERSARQLLQQRGVVESQAILLERVEEIVHANCNAQIPDEARQCASWRTAELRGCSFARDIGRPILDGVHLRFEVGDTLCIIGRSGAGKTTLLDIIAGIETMQEGTIVLDGQELSCNAVESLGALKVAQEAMLIAGTIRENILFGLPDPGEAELGRVCYLADLDAFIHSRPGGMDCVINDTRKLASVGEAHRICLARVLLRHPKILLLDETLSALERRQRDEILGRVKAWDPGLVIVMVSHVPSEVAQCGRVLKLEGGGLVEIARSADLEGRAS